VTFTLWSGTVTLTLYPEPASGFFLKGGVGLSMVDTQFREGSTTVTIDPGYGLGVATNWKQNVVDFTVGVTFH
jgi:hypothetical protein